MLAEQGLGGGPYAQPLAELFGAAYGHPGALGRESLDVILLLLQQALGDEHRHIYVLVTGLLEAAVHITLHILPDSVAVGPDDHAAFNVAVVDQLGLLDYIRIPFSEIFVAAGDGLDHFFVLIILSHNTLLSSLISLNIIIILLLKDYCKYKLFDELYRL